MTRSSICVGWLAAASIALLRIGIGVHFLDEGWTKLEHPRPFSAGFFGNAKGPLSPYYKNLVWDADGLFRLDAKSTLAVWDDYRGRIVGHYGLDDKQQKAAADTLKRYSDRLKQFLGGKDDTIVEYQQWLKRRDENAGKSYRELASLKSQDVRIAGEIGKLRAELVPPLDRLAKDYEDAMNSLATQEQWTRHGRLTISKPGRMPIDTETLDRIVPWFDLAVGVCLILGLFTRPAALAAAAFLGAICLSQWPLAPGAAPIYNQAVEALALLVLAAVGAGQFLGLDWFLGGLRAICCSAKTAQPAAK